MKVIYQDLINLLQKKPTIKELSSKLFQLGHEHEIHNNIIDLELTPNRGDCISLAGIARDLKPFFGEVKSPELYEGSFEELDLDFKNLSPEDCPKITFLEVEVSELNMSYKPYLENYFKTLGNNKVNFFTDISNYVSYELGQPTHCYDAMGIKDQIIFDNKVVNSTFRTLFDTEVSLNGKNCLFIQDGEIINLAGVMGGKKLSCTTDTRKVLIECAFFKPESILGKSVKYNINSDAAHKFERGVDPSIHIRALKRFIKIVEDHAKILSLKLKTYEYGNHNKISLPINTYKINKILGTKLEKKEIINILHNLSFVIVDDHIKVPDHRHDIFNLNDIAEEIARVIGYNNIPSSPINLECIIPAEITYEETIKLELINSGFSEVINFPFCSSDKTEAIKIDNPLDINKNKIRTTLKDSLINNLLYNERRQKDSIKLFEISDLYSKKDNIIKQKRMIGIIATGRVGHNYVEYSQKINNKYINEVCDFLSGKFDFEVTEIDRKNLNTKNNNKIYYIEFEISNEEEYLIAKNNIKKPDIKFIEYNPVSEFPSSSRDFSFSVTDLSKVDYVLDSLMNAKANNLKNSFLFDFFINKKSNEVKVGYRFIFQSKTKTLSDDDVSQSIDEILTPILKIDGVKIPGMNL